MVDQDRCSPSPALLWLHISSLEIDTGGNASSCVGDASFKQLISREISSLPFFVVLVAVVNVKKFDIREM